MFHGCLKTGWVCCLGLFWFYAVHAQPATLPHARLFLISPCGGQLGKVVRVTVAGIDLEEARSLHFSHPGLSAKLVPDPAKPGQFLPNQFDITIAANTPVGLHDVRVVGKYGISNPRVFAVGACPEVMEKEPNNDVPQAQLITLDTTVNGTIASNVDVDYFQFDAKKGQRLIIICQGKSIDSLLDPEMRLYHPSGKLLATERAIDDSDLSLTFTPEIDGRYVIRLCQFGHVFGDAYHYYRLTVSTGPWIETVFPPVIQAGTETQVTLWGCNLPGSQPDPTIRGFQPPLEKWTTKLACPNPPAGASPSFRHTLMPTRQALFDGFDYQLQAPNGWSNRVVLSSTIFPVVIQTNGNTAAEKAQTVPFPCEVAGRFAHSKEQHWYRFQGKAGQVVIIEGYADRLGAPLDLYFEIRRPDNKQSLGEFDDHPEAYAPLRFFARTEDPKVRIGLPVDGLYEIMVGARNNFEARLASAVYRLSLQPDQQDFRLAVLDHYIQSPGALHVPRGGLRHLEVYVYRMNAFGGPIQLSAELLPPGVTCTPQLVNPGAPQAVLVISAAADAPAYDGPIRIKGTALINGKEVTRWAQGGCYIWPNPAEPNGVPSRSRLSQEICLSVREPDPFTIEPEMNEVSVPVGGAIPLKLNVHRNRPEANVPITIAALNMPLNAVFNGNNAPIGVAPNVSEVALTIQIPANVPPGEYTLTMFASANVPFNKDPKNPQKPPVLATVPIRPIKVTVFPPIAIKQQKDQAPAKQNAMLTLAPRQPWVHRQETYSFQRSASFYERRKAYLV